MTLSSQRKKIFTIAKAATANIFAAAQTNNFNNQPYSG